VNEPAPKREQSATEPLRVDFERLRDDIEGLSQIGRSGLDHGLYRSAFNDAYMEAHAWVKHRAEQAGLHVWVDGAYNLHARLGPDEPGRVATGSHVDSVPRGGHLDGALGVVAGLEALRRAKESGVVLARPLELIVFADEEGRFGGMFGSQAIAGKLTPDMILNACDLDGVSLTEAMGAWDLDAMHALRAAVPHNVYESFVELHIEQGPVLDDLGISVGVVQGIVGLFRWNVKLIGAANHAGTTPMDRRKDAFSGLAEVAGEINRVLEEDGAANSVATIGRVVLGPGAANVVPRTAEFSLEVRDLDPEVLEALALSFRKTISAVARRRGLMFEYEVVSELEPVVCDAKIMDIIAAKSDAIGVKRHTLPSGAAHDAMQMASLARMGMVFVPSKDGRSHTPKEWTDWESIELGSSVLLNTLVELAR